MNISVVKPLHWRYICKKIKLSSKNPKIDKIGIKTHTGIALLSFYSEVISDNVLIIEAAIKNRTIWENVQMIIAIKYL